MNSALLNFCVRLSAQDVLSKFFRVDAHISQPYALVCIYNEKRQTYWNR